MPTRKVGPLTGDELLRGVWASVVDSEYARPLLEGGDGHGLEVPGQAANQLAFVSTNVDKTTQALFVLPWSGQTQPPAGGELFSTVTIRVTRTSGFDVPAIVFNAGSILFEEEVNDFSTEGAIRVRTGRRYCVLVTNALLLGQTYVDISCAAIAPGAGFNFPLPDTITAFVEPGVGLSNIGASVVPGLNATHNVIARQVPDVPSPQHVGLYLQMLGGANTGQIRSIVGYLPPGPSDGGAFVVAATSVLRSVSIGSQFIPGEDLEQVVTLARGRFIAQTDEFIVFTRLSGTFSGTDNVSGILSGLTMTPTNIELAAEMVPEVGTATWRIVPYEELGLSATNPLSPVGGRLGVLDQLGSERGIGRASGEPDDLYRRRVSEPADVVSPNALRRAANRVLAPLGLSACLREVGTTLFNGTYCEEDFFDYDSITFPDKRFRVLVDYEEMRAFFLMGIPAIPGGEFGGFYDDDPSGGGFFDVGFADGFPITASVLRQTIWKALNAARAGGVGFELVQQTGPCTV